MHNLPGIVIFILTIGGPQGSGKWVGVGTSSTTQKASIAGTAPTTPVVNMDPHHMLANHAITGFLADIADQKDQVKTT